MPILMACLTALTLVSISFGWIQNAWPSTIQFAAGSTPEYTFYKITFPKQGATNQTVSIVEGTSIGTPVESIETEVTQEIAGENDAPATTTTVINFAGDLQFGTITNLYFLENDNYVFYAIRIPYSMGTEVHAAVSYGAYDEDGDPTVTFGNHFKIYNEQKVPITGNKLTQVQGIETEYGDTFVSYACALSTNAPSNEMTFATLDSLFQNQAMSPVAKMTQNGTVYTAEPTDLVVYTYDYTAETTAATTEAPTEAPAEGGDEESVSETESAAATHPEYYYLYIKLQPNMELYKYFIDYLYADMPFYLAYQIGVQLYVTPATES